MALTFFCSSLHIRLAQKSVQRVGADDAPIDQRDDAIAAIMFSASAIEAIVNELPTAADQIAAIMGDEKLAALASVLGEAEEQNAQVRQKLQLAMLTLTGRPLDRGRQPFQGFSLLVDLRNELTHQKPEEVDENQRNKLVARLNALARCRVPAAGGQVAWTNLIATRAVAEWALGVVRAVCVTLKDALGQNSDLMLATMANLDAQGERIEELDDTVEVLFT